MLTEWHEIFSVITHFLCKKTLVQFEKDLFNACVSMWNFEKHRFTVLQLKSDLQIRSDLPFLRDTKRRVRPWTAWWCRSGWSSNPRPRKRHPHSRWQPKELNTFIWKCHFSVNNKMSERNLQNTWGSFLLVKKSQKLRWIIELNHKKCHNIYRISAKIVS